MHSKTKLRQHFRQLRQQLNPQQQQKAAVEFSNQIVSSALLEKKTFACYLAQDNELDMMPLIEKLWEHNKTVTVPVITHGYDHNILAFRIYAPDTALVSNQYHILEPLDSKIIELADIDVVFIPLVAFDKYGVRLGMGGGFYDRTLAGIKHNNAESQPLLMGVGHACQESDKLPVDSWDVKMHGVMTDNGLVSEHELPSF